jgi:hypothetical protein
MKPWRSRPSFDDICGNDANSDLRDGSSGDLWDGSDAGLRGDCSDDGL